MAILSRRSLFAAGAATATTAAVSGAGQAHAAQQSEAVSAARAEQVEAANSGRLPTAITAQAFKSPSVRHRPAVRWWWSAPLSVEESVREATAIAKAGFGEVEIAYSTDSWASGEQRENLRAVLDAAASLDLRVSMTMGANWPVQTPNTGAGSGYAQQEVQYGRADASDGRFSGEVPWPFDDPDKKRKAQLVAATVARVLERGPAAELLPENERPPYGTPIKVPSKSTVLAADSLLDVTGDVVDGKLTWQAPGAGDWIVFGFWRREGERGVTSVFDAEAARKATDYLDEHQVGKDNVEALKKCGGDFFEDSLELDADSLFWAPGFPEEFKRRRGYDMAAYLPLMFQHGMSRYWVPAKPPVADFDLPDGGGGKVRADYYRLITDLYVDNHLKPFQQWARGYGMTYKTQAAYGQDLEPIRSFRELARAGGRVEGESYNSGDRFPTDIRNYGWRYALDWQRTVVGGAHQGGALKVSTELGAQPEQCHQITPGDYKAIIDKEWAAGITQPFLHGFQYMSEGAGWPGKYRFGDNLDSFNDRHNPQWPALSRTTEYWARGALVLESGSPRTDVAVYRDGFLTTAARLSSDEGTQPAALFDTLALERHGYSLQYIDPVGLAEESAVGKKVLCPSGPQYRALVIDERALPLEAARAVERAVAAGVTVVFVGEPPRRDTVYRAGRSADREVAESIRRALRGPAAVTAKTQADVLQALQERKVLPRVRWNDAHVLSQLRYAHGVRYLFLYNPTGSVVEFTPAMEGTGAVSVLRLWDGTIEPAAQYRYEHGRTLIPTRLHPQETRVLALDTSASAPVHVVDSDLAADLRMVDGRIELHTAEAGTRSFTLSDGRRVAVTARPARMDTARPGPFAWRLSVEAVTPDGPKTIDIPTLSGTFPLWDWRDREQIAGESGVGTYTGTLTVPGTWLGSGQGVQLNLGTVEGAAEIRLNGDLVGTQITSDVTWDVTEQLKAGANEVRVVVRTTLRNAVTHYKKTSSRTSSYGLRGPVMFTPFAIEVLHPQRP
ncbi:glycosyl hydrolase [Streptomyces sp. NPDC057302]|uniref:glycosyl hydrolase n=1 Tax=Streptomyces sp. NPDC057302 TaxID=3346094 RepID=UPI00362C3B38